jgi:hypothetical protein
MSLRNFQGYGWLKEKVLNEEGRKQQNKLRELTILATTFDCTVAQLAIGIQIKNSSSIKFFSFSMVFKK